MSNRPSAKESRNGLAAVAASSRRSPLFLWMVDQHDELIRLGAAGGFSWRVLCSVATELGLADKKGQPPSPETARKTWRRARAYARERQQTPTSPIPPDQVEVSPMRSSVPMGARAATVPSPIAIPTAPSWAPADRSVSPSVPSWMPVEYPPSQSSAPVLSDQPRTGLNRMGETPEEAAHRSAKNLAAVRRTIAEAAGHIPPRKV